MSRRRSPSVKNPTSSPARLTTLVAPGRPGVRVITSIAASTVASSCTQGLRSPVRISSPTLISLRPRSPPGWKRAKSSGPKSRPSCTTSASASPSASMAVVDALGARPCGPGSAICPSSSTTSLWRPSVESFACVIATSAAPQALTCGSMTKSSSVSPDLENASSRSPASTRPRSPWIASAGCRKIDGVPVDASVADVFWAMKPALPMPVVTTRPRSPRTMSSARRNGSPRPSATWRTAAASHSTICRARSIRGSIGTESLSGDRR